MYAKKVVPKPWLHYSFIKLSYRLCVQLCPSFAPLRPRAARGCWRGGGRGGPPPEQNFPQILLSQKSFPKLPGGAGLRGGRERGSPPKKCPKFFFLTNFPRRGHCGRRPSGGSGEGRGRGGPPLPQNIFFPKSSPKLPWCAGGGVGRGVSPPKKISPKFFFPKIFPEEGHCGRSPPGGAGGREGVPLQKMKGREAPHSYLQ